jgi:hypothetical protein
LQRNCALTIFFAAATEKRMAQSGIQGACAAWRNAVNLLAKGFGLEPLHTRAPRKDFEKLLAKVVERYESGATAVAKQDKLQAYKDLELVRQENRRLRELIEELRRPVPRPRLPWRRQQTHQNPLH